MTLLELGKGLLRHASLALAWLVTFFLIAERLAPGSVSPYLNLSALAFCAFLLAVLSPAFTELPGRRFRVIGFVTIISLLLAFLFLVSSDYGTAGLSLTVAAVILSIAWLMAIAYDAENV